DYYCQSSDSSNNHRLF
nr:immunoglobulin light chain junction region [Macaca mulatta]